MAGLLEWVPPLVGLLAAVMVTLRAVRVREARGAWTAHALGLWLYAAGNVARPLPADELSPLLGGAAVPSRATRAG